MVRWLAIRKMDSNLRFNFSWIWTHTNIPSKKNQPRQLSNLVALRSCTARTARARWPLERAPRRRWQASPAVWAAMSHVILNSSCSMVLDECLFHLPIPFQRRKSSLGSGLWPDQKKRIQRDRKLLTVHENYFQRRSAISLLKGIRTKRAETAYMTCSVAHDHCLRASLSPKVVWHLST